MGRISDFDILLDPEGILHIRIDGVWTRAEVDAFFAALVPYHATARTAHGRVLALVTIASIQSPLVALHVRDHALAIKRPGDRTAMVVATPLSKLQIKRIASTEGFGLFTEPEAALAWLREW